MKLRLSQSRLRTARSCQRKHHFEWDIGVVPTTEIEVLRFGTLVHKGLEAWWLAAADERLERALEAIRSSPDSDPFEVVKAEAMLEGYHERWKDQPYEILGVEVPFSTELRNPDTGRPSTVWQLEGIIDGIVRHQHDGRTLLVEHKTSSEDITPGATYWKRLRMDGQVSVYYEGGSSLGHQIDGCLYDVLGKPGQRPLKATPPESRKYKKDGTLYANLRDVDETPAEYKARLVEANAADPDHFYQRGEVVRLEDERVVALRDVWQLSKQLREAQLAESFPRNPDACMSYGRTCPFFSVCSGEASLDDVRLFTRRESATTQEPALVAP